MNPRKIVAAAALVAAAASAAVLVARAEEEEAPPAAPAADGAHAADVRALGDADFAARQRAYERLREAGEAARAPIEEGVRSSDPQVRWAARRLLRLLDERAGAAAPRERTLRFDDVPSAGGAQRRADGRDGGAGEEQDRRRADRPWVIEIPRVDFGDMERHMAEMRERMADLEARFRSGFAAGARAFAGNGGAVARQVIRDDGKERLSLSIDEEGRVRASVGVRDAEGRLSEKTVEAESLEALGKCDPEIHAKVKDLAGESFTLHVGRRGPWDDAAGRRRGAATGPGDAGGRTWTPGQDGAESWGAGGAVFGVTVMEVPEVLRSHVDIPADAGLAVDSVLAESVAERLGVRRHDLVLTVNGLPVSTPEDLRSAVAAVPAGGALQVEVLRGGLRTPLRGVR